MSRQLHKRSETEVRQLGAPFYANPFFKGVIYDKQARFAFTHGESDGGSIGLDWEVPRINEVTPEHIYFVGRLTMPNGEPRLSGSIDRRTGHGHT